MNLCIENAIERTIEVFEGSELRVRGLGFWNDGHVCEGTFKTCMTHGYPSGARFVRKSAHAVARDIVRFVTKEQCRAARGLLGWTIAELAEESQVSRNTVADFEAGRTDPRRVTINSMRFALERAGVEFTNGGQPGVRFARRVPPDGSL